MPESAKLPTVAEVVVEVSSPATDRPFHYLVPPGVHLGAGARVMVPFSGRTVEGFVVGFRPGSPADELKGIERLLDHALDESQLELARALADETGATLYDSLRSFLPPGGRGGTRRRLVAAFPPSQLPAVAEGVADRVALVEALRLLAVRRTVGRGELTRRFGGKTAARVVRHLVERGWARREDQHAGVGREKTRLWAVLAPEAEQADLGRARRQSAVRDWLAQRREAPLTDLLEQCEVSRSVVDGLVARGLVVLEERAEQRDPYAHRRFDSTSPFRLTPEQARAFSQIQADLTGEGGNAFLLHGVTGSGKTEIYLQSIACAIEQGLGAIVLVPEIALTPQMVARFKARFGDRVAVLHSALSEGERYDEWQRLAAEEARVAVGARSAIFAPVQDLGLIIIDEEHENSYKQEAEPRYHARQVALARARQSRATLVLGSATPSLESYHQAREGAFRLLELPARIDGRPLPPVRVIDLREELANGNRSIFSHPLAQAIDSRLSREEQVILFLNRRGFSTFVLCRECGFVLRCPHCDVSLTLHRGEGRTVCHYCGYSQPVPNVCPGCRGSQIRYFGIGTERVEAEVRKAFPQARVLRLDSDTTGQKGSHERILDAFANGQADILVGTQMVAKGLDFPGVTLVGVITADTMLNLPDFRAAERTFALLTQVAGRAGRGPLGGEVLVQTYAPDNYAIKMASQHDYKGFYAIEIENRRELGYPPWTRLAVLSISGTDELKVEEAANELGRLVEDKRGTGAISALLGPGPAPLYRIGGRYRRQVVVKLTTLEPGVSLLREASRQAAQTEWGSQVAITLDIDAHALL
ncbi:MAG: primosomal protein N' [Bacillota bacterium]